MDSFFFFFDGRHRYASIYRYILHAWMFAMFAYVHATETPLINLFNKLQYSFQSHLFIV
jgi:hypothetical protein